MSKFLGTTPYSEGDPTAKILFIAEAPAYNEIMQNRPLVGPAGKVFDECLNKAGILRTQVSIANACRERIKSTSGFVGSNGRLTEHGLAVRRDLMSRIKDHTPNVIVPVGGMALAMLYPDNRITKLRGSILESPVWEGKKLIPSVHPAYTLPHRTGSGRGSKGNYLYRFSIVEDFKKALRQSTFPDVRIPGRTLIVAPTLSDVIEFCDAPNHGKVGCDIETYNHQVSCLSIAPHLDLSMSIPFVGRNPREDYWTEEDEAMVWMAVARLMENPDVCKVWHNGVTFDLPFLFMQNRIRCRNIHDTMVRHRILFPDFSAKLEYVVSIFTDEPYYKDDRKLWETPHKDPETFWRYNARDSAVTIEVENVLAPMIEEDEGYKWTYDNTMSLLDPCMYAGMNGFRVDTERMEVLKNRVKTELAQVEQELNDTAEAPFNPNSPKQCVAYFYGTKGLHPYVNRKTGNPTCDDKALARIVRKYNLPEARLVQKIRGLGKLLSTYLEVELDKDGRLRCVYDPRGTTTGRLSSKQTPIRTGMNMQNQDPRFKHFIVPDEEE
jgi:uracil-DNA glycosylase family 4